MHKKIWGIIGLSVVSIILVFIFSSKLELYSVSNNPTYLDSIDAVDYSLIGLNQIKEDETNKNVQNNKYYYYSLNFISSYMATGDERYLEIAKEGAEYIKNNISSLGLVNENLVSYASNQSSTLSMISYLAMIDNKYLDLVELLADGIVNNYINDYNNLVWSKLNSETGIAINDEHYGYESQFSHSSLKCAQSLLVAYRCLPEKIEYKNKAIDIVYSIWERRDKNTNLISESWDVLNDKPAIKMYPYSDFRYDDMGGVFLRTLMLAYNITNDDKLIDIMKIYAPALVKGIWDTTINGGAFRYLNTVEGRNSDVSMLETMYGLFTATLIQVSEIIDDEWILKKCIENSDNVLISGFGLKNNMVPHAIDNLGNYLNERSDSQLGYAIIQFPLGYSMLSNVTGNDEYREKSNIIINTFIERHKANEEGIPIGYVNRVETISPYETEKDYLKPEWMQQIAYLPFYLLYNSIQTKGDIKINWDYGNQPNVLGLVNDIPIWDINLVNMNINNKTLKLKEVTGKGIINLSSIGLGEISDVLVDGKKYTKFNKFEIETQKGTHSYEIIWK